MDRILAISIFGYCKRDEGEDGHVCEQVTFSETLQSDRINGIAPHIMRQISHAARVLE
ncbi:MAG: hypothetical protein ACJ04P_08630 [Halioglobus sp.]